MYWVIDGIITDSTTPGQSETVNIGKEDVHHTSQIYITGVSLSDVQNLMTNKS